jgi:hypothetical protein
MNSLKVVSYIDKVLLQVIHKVVNSVKMDIDQMQIIGDVKD